MSRCPPRIIAKLSAWWKKQPVTLLPGVDQVVVLGAFGRRRAEADDAVLAVHHHLAAGDQVVRHQRRQADAEVDDRAVGDVLRHALRHLLACPAFELRHAGLPFRPRS
jgi:hypothetical protein